MSALSRDERIALERACEERIESLSLWLNQRSRLTPEDAQYTTRLCVLAERSSLVEILGRLRRGEPLEAP